MLEQLYAGIREERGIKTSFRNEPGETSSLLPGVSREPGEAGQSGRSGGLRPRPRTTAWATEEVALCTRTASADSRNPRLSCPLDSYRGRWEGPGRECDLLNLKPELRWGQKQPRLRDPPPPEAPPHGPQ